jgi:PAS domain S-box-containing protein
MDQPALLTVIDSVPALVAYIDCNMIVQFCNQPFKTWFSHKGDITGQSFVLHVGKPIFNQIQRQLGKVLSGEPANFQIAITNTNAFHYLESTLSPDFDAQNSVRGFIFHGVDITQKSRTEIALKDYFENASIGLHWVNGDGIIVWANPVEMKMLGYEEHEYLGQHISKFHADEKVITDILGRLANKESIINSRADLICKNGSIKHVTINSSGLWQGDDFVHSRCFTIDVTEQTLSARAVIESEEQFKMMTTLVPLVIWTMDECGDCNFLSVKWQELTGKHVADGLGTQWSNFIHPDDRENIVTAWTTSFQHRKPFQAKFRLLTAAERYCIAYANSTPRYNTSGRFSGYIGVIQDISADEQIRQSLEKMVIERTEDLRDRNAELKQAEKELRKKNDELQTINKQLSSFAHVASHDLQEPLRKITTLSNLLYASEGSKFSDKGNNLFNRIQTSSERMSNLIQDLLAYSKTNATEVETALVDLNQVWNEVANELEISIAEKNALVENEGLPQVNVTRFQFHQLFSNLLSNALKFSKTIYRPHILIKSEIISGAEVVNGLGDVDKKYYHITLSDNGIGFEPHAADKIFDIFCRLHGRKEYEGTGIGLSICKKIVENHNGQIVAEGQVDAGAVFRIYLPAQ